MISIRRFKRIKNKSNINTTINTVASITTILALIVALTTFYDVKNQETEYRHALTAELINEIDYNLIYIDGIQNIRDKLTTTYEVPTYDFSTIILEEALRYGKIGNITTKKEMFDALLVMHAMNNMMEKPIYDIHGDNTPEGYIKIKKERYDFVLKKSEHIRLLLKEIKTALSTDIK